MESQKTPFHSVAETTGATFGQFGAWKLPTVYSDVASEWRAAKEQVVLHDSSHVGRLKATGQDVLDLLHRLSTNDVGSLQPGEGAPTVLTTDRGRILDLITVLHLGEYVLLLSSPPTREQVAQWIDKYTIMEEVELEDITTGTGLLSLLGPKASSLLESLTGLRLAGMQNHCSEKVDLGGLSAHLIRRDTVGLPGFLLMVQQEEASKLWDTLISAGALPMGMEAYQALRVEAGWPDYGEELGEPYNPLEAGLAGAISFTKGCYIGQEVIARLDTYDKVQRHLVSFILSGDGRVANGTVLCQDGMEVGNVTSVAKVPTTGQLVGMGYVRRAAAQEGVKLSFGNGVGEAKVRRVLEPPWGRHSVSRFMSI